MLKPVYTTRFEKDLKKALKQGKDCEKFKQTVRNLLEQHCLAPQFKDHPLKGNYSGRRCLHLEPDWILIYKIIEGCIIFERTGSHSDLFC